jgi:hypothetical protein
VYSGYLAGAPSVGDDPVTFLDVLDHLAGTVAHENHVCDSYRLAALTGALIASDSAARFARGRKPIANRQAGDGTLLRWVFERK